ncbi:MAG TPA: DPP IV N-terminal domain-containing protein, partial [Flavobacterium sp.]|nr:DPP IV N-terminal domain-containing protein [Flavobacterium sp.]
MAKKIMLALFILIGLSADAQTKKFTLEEAVLQQNRAFRADMLLGFQWIPNTNKYTFFEDSARKLMTASATNTTASEMVTLAQLGKATGAEFKSFAGLHWLNPTTFTIQNSTDYYTYNVSSGTATKVLSVPADAENATFDEKNRIVAYTIKNNLYIAGAGGENLSVTKNDNKNIVSGQSIARNEFGISGGIFWSPNAAKLAFYQKDETEVAEYPLLDITTTPGQLENIKYPMIGQKSEKPRVGIYDVATRETVFISPKENADDYLTNLSWTPDEKYVLIAELNRGQNSMNLNLYEANSGAFVRTILQESNSAWVEPEHPAFFPNPKSSNFIWISEKDGFNNLYYYTIEGKLIKKLTQNNFPIKEILGANAAGTEIYFTATGLNPTNTLVYKIDLKGKQTQITKDEGVHSVSFSTDGSWFFDQYSNHSTPGKSIL